MPEVTDTYRKTLESVYPRSYQTLITIKEYRARGYKRAKILELTNMVPITYDRGFKRIKEFDTKFPELTFTPDPKFKIPHVENSSIPPKLSLMDKMVIQAIKAKKDSARVNDLRRALSGELPWNELEERMMD